MPRFHSPLLVAGPLVALSLLLVPVVAQANSTAQQQCEATKNRVAGKYAACRQRAAAQKATTSDVSGYTRTLARCASKFGSAWQHAVDRAGAGGLACLDAPLTAGDFKTAIDAHSQSIGTALGGGGLALCESSTCGNGTIEGDEDCETYNLNGQTCVTQGFVAGTLACGAGCTFDTSMCFPLRFLDLGNTVLDIQTRLEWEKTFDFGGGSTDPHDVTNTYTWGDLPGCSYTGCPNGTVFTDFLGRINGCRSNVGHPSSSSGGCGWRVPSLYELSTIVDLAAAGCGTYPNTCIDPIFGPTSPDGPYVSSTSDDSAAGQVLGVQFSDGAAVSAQKTLTWFVRAVRDAGNISFAI